MKEYILKLLDKYDDDICLVYSEVKERMLEENYNELSEIILSFEQLMVIEAMFQFDDPYDENEPNYFRNMFNSRLNEILENL